MDKGFSDKTINPEPEYTSAEQLSNCEAMMRLEPELPWHLWQVIEKMRNIRSQLPEFYNKEFGLDLIPLVNLYEKLQEVYGEGE